MAIICPLTNEKVLYIECLECEEKKKCKMGILEKDGENCKKKESQ